MGQLGPIFGMFHNLLPHCNHSNYLPLIIYRTVSSHPETGWLGPTGAGYKAHYRFVFFATTIAGQMNYWSIKNKTK